MSYPMSTDSTVKPTASSTDPLASAPDMATVLAHHMSTLQDLHGVCVAQQTLLERQGQLLDEQTQLLEEVRAELATLRTQVTDRTANRGVPGAASEGRDDGQTVGE